MACLEQFQLCYGSTSRCGPLASWLDAQDGASKLFNFPLEREGPPADNHPASRFYWFVALFTYAVPGIPAVLLQLGPSSLASMRSLFAGVMGPLPDDQWQIDVMQWWATYLAGIQSAVVSIASGPIDPSLEHLRIRPYNQWIQESICNNQVRIPFLEDVFQLWLERQLPQITNTPHARSFAAPTIPPSVFLAYILLIFLDSSSSSLRYVWIPFWIRCPSVSTVAYILTWSGPQRTPYNCSGWPSRASSRARGPAPRARFL